MQAEEKKEIIVLDEGVDIKDSFGPDGFCCGTAIWPTRG